MKENYYLKYQEVVLGLDDKKTKLLLHSCCAPCSSACLELLTKHFDVTVFYFNPNITDEEEYLKRLDEQLRFCARFNVPVICGEYNPKIFIDAVTGYENQPEGGSRCSICYKLRLERTAKMAKEQGFDYFCSTLSVSPYKNAEKLNLIGAYCEKTYGVKHLPNDFKKKDGYKRSIELSNEYGLYRQDFCGCEFSKR